MRKVREDGGPGLSQRLCGHQEGPLMESKKQSGTASLSETWPWRGVKVGRGDCGSGCGKGPGKTGNRHWFESCFLELG